MSQIDQAFTLHAERLKKILRKHKSGKPLSSEELALIGIQPEPAAAPAAQKSSSIAAAVVDLRAHGFDVSKEFLRQLKREGGAAAGFEASNRVNLDRLIPFLRARVAAAPQDAQRLDKQTLECRRLLALCERLEHGNKIEFEQYAPKAAMADSVRRFGARFIPVFRQKLLNEYPAAVAGKDIPQARDYGGKLFDTFMLALREFESEWPA